ncbi:MAG: DUF3791 domain-containing protein [Lachnospiraceae bacterium]|nr:DUF3791 domain-containing protein [Lachnospiraceae bacterium]
MKDNLINPVAFLQVHIARLFMERHGLSPEKFIALDKQKDILGFLKLGYEPFHLTGDEGILDELDAYLKIVPSPPTQTP